MKKIGVLPLLIIATSLSVFSQTRISNEYRGTEEAIARGVLDGNQVETNFRNHGEHSRWGDIPWGIWPKNTGGRHIDGFGFIMSAQVLGERAKWSVYYGEGAQDTILNPVIINYRHSGVKLSPYNGAVRGWLPLSGFHNPYRLNVSSGNLEPIPAISTDPESWPTFWPDRLGESIDAGWQGSWNGFRGKGLVTGAQETFYVMDDFSDKEYAFGEETEGPHSLAGVYYPNPSDSTIGGLGLQVEVRTFQFNDVIAKDILFTQYRTTNVSEKDLDDVWTGMILDLGLGLEEDDDISEFLPKQKLFIFRDTDGTGFGTIPEYTYELGQLGLLLLEYSTIEDNGIDDDEDGIIDESKFNGPGELIEGKAAIDAYLDSNYNMELFLQKHIGVEKFPAYQSERWWTGDEDLDWVAFDDLNQNGIQDDGEDLLDDVGRDGIGPNHELYVAADEGEGDGVPTQGEPNFGEQDMLEAELSEDISFWDMNTRPEYETGDNLRDDNWLFGKIKENQFDVRPPLSGEFNSGDEPLSLAGIGPYSLKKNTSSYFIIALIFGKDREDLLKKVESTKAIYESDYGQSLLLTSNEDDRIPEIPMEFSLSQNYPNPFNPITNIEFNLSKAAPVSLIVYDITGRQVKSLISGQTYTSGAHSVELNGNDLASGLYIYQLRVAGEVFTKKLTLIK